MVKNKVVTLDTSIPVELTMFDEVNSGGTVLIQNHSTTENVYLGGPNVSGTNFGVLVYPESVFTLDLNYLDRLYAVASASSVTASVLVLDRE